MRRFLLWGIALCAVLATPSAAGAEPAANIVSIQGAGQFRPERRSEWTSAKIEQALVGGDFVRTGDYSRMGLLFRDRTQLRLNEKTILQVKAGETETRVRLDLGRAWTQSKTLPGKLYMETPSATAAIRGTDWHLEVDENGRAVITVLSGEVEFFNDLGRVVVRKDEAAEATIGRAPAKLLLVNPRDRVQWVSAHQVSPLRHISLSRLSAADLMPSLATADAATKGRILADLGLWKEAETAFRGRTADNLGLAYAALRKGQLDEAEALLASVADPADAELLALGRVSHKIYKEEFGAAFARLTALTRDDKPSQPAAFLLLADLMIFAGDPAQAARSLQRGLQHFPGDPRLHAALAKVYLLADERAKSRAEVANARKSDDRSLEAALAEGELAHVDGDVKGARQGYRRAMSIRESDDRGWYGAGKVDTEREDVREGRRSLLRALELNPLGPGYRGELGTLESLADNFPKARLAFEQALAERPDDYVALTGLGLLELKVGNTDQALDAFLRAGLMEPRYARVHVYAAVAYYQNQRTQQALEELKRAASIDEMDPMPHFMASIIYTDAMQPGPAIESARIALRLMPHLKSLNQLANDQQGVTNLGQSFAFLGMEEWAIRYAQESYYPFWAGSHLFLADRYSGLFTKNSELYQGFVADPMVFGGSNRFQTLLPKPVTNLSASMRVTHADDSQRTSPNVQMSGFRNALVPFAFFLDHEEFHLRVNGMPLNRKTTTAALGAKPLDSLGLFLFADQSRQDAAVTSAMLSQREDIESGRADIGMHFKFSPDSQLWAKAGHFRSDNDIVATLVFVPVVARVEVRQPEWGARHTYSSGEGHELTWGFEEGKRRTAWNTYNNALAPDGYILGDNDYEEISRDAYVSDRWRVGPNLLLQGDVFYQRHTRKALYANDMFLLGTNFRFETPEDRSRSRFNPRLGLTYRIDEGPQFRFAYQRWLRPSIFSSLGPVATVGIPLDDRLVMHGGELTRWRGQLDWEMTKKSFLAAYLDYRKIDNNRFALRPFAQNELESLAKLRPRRLGSLANDDMLEFPSTPDFAGGRIKSLGLSLNYLLSDQWGAFGRYVAYRSSNTEKALSGKAVPYMPRQIWAAGATWAAGNGWYFISRLVHRSDRYSDEANQVLLDAGWNGAFDVYWQSPQRHWLLRFSVDDVFDKNMPTLYTGELNVRF